jgi:hypothetical protein
MGSTYSTNTFTLLSKPKPAFRAGVLLVRGKLSGSYAEMRGFGHCRRATGSPSTQGVGPTRPPGICRAQQETREKFKHGAFGFRFSWSRGHARQNLWPYIRRDVTHSGGLKSLQRTEARGASANSMRSVRASISWQSGLLLQWLLSQPPSQKRLRGHLGHATILLDLQHSLPSGGLSRVKRAVTSLAGKTDQNCTEMQKITDTNNR